MRMAGLRSRRSQKLAAESDGKYTVQQIQDQMAQMDLVMSDGGVAGQCASSVGRDAAGLDGVDAVRCE
ncbi:hypothetical protein WT12_12130 [Burkholderia territorii]|nr:hypothetical protein WS97_08470 [Burkholderia territorii]KVN47653.1 hypothetical protein WT12_12130 [Burkholderia territorii]